MAFTQYLNHLLINTLVKLVLKISNLLSHIFLPINLQNGGQRNLHLLEIAVVSYWIEFIFKAVIGQYYLRTIFLHSHWRKQCMDIQRERKIVDKGLKLKVSTEDIRIK